MICSLPGFVFCQTTTTTTTYYKPQGSYVPPVTTKTYTSPAPLRAPVYSPQNKATTGSGYSSGTSTYSSSANNNYESAKPAVQGPERMDRSSIVVMNNINDNQTIYLARRYNSVLEKSFYGYVNNRKEIVIAFAYDEAREFIEERAAVRKGNRWGFIDSTGAMVVPALYSMVGNYQDGFVSAIQNRKMGLIDEFGGRIVHDKYDYVSPPTYGLCLTQLNGKWGFMDLVQKVKVPFIYEEAAIFTDDGLARVKLNGKWGFINYKGETVVDFLYDGECNFSEDLAAVYFDGKCGFIDRKGKLVIPFEYAANAMCPTFYKGYAMVMKKKKFGWVDKQGKYSKEVPAEIKISN